MTTNFEFKTFNGTQISKDELLGYVKLLGYDIISQPINSQPVEIPPLNQFDHFNHKANPFQDYLKSINLFISATNKEGFAMRTDKDKENTCPLYEQLSFDSNSLLAKNLDLKEKVTTLVNNHINLWSHIEGKRPYGSAQGLEFEINLIDPNMRPIKQQVVTTEADHLFILLV